MQYHQVVGVEEKCQQLDAAVVLCICIYMYGGHRLMCVQKRLCKECSEFDMY